MLAKSITPSDYSALAAHIRANTDPVVVAAVAVRNDSAICDWYNVASSTDAWNEQMTRSDLFEAMPITVFDGLTAGKRDAWRLILEQASQSPLDFGKAKVRAVVRDIWPATNADAILSACLRKATRGELVFGGAVEASGIVSALDLAIEETLTVNTISDALNLG